MTYVLENINAKGQYLAKDMDTAFGSELESGDVTDVEHAMTFENEHELMCFSVEMAIHRTIMIKNYGKDAFISLDIVEVLKGYRPKGIN